MHVCATQTPRALFGRSSCPKAWISTGRSARGPRSRRSSCTGWSSSSSDVSTWCGRERTELARQLNLSETQVTRFMLLTRDKSELRFSIRFCFQCNRLYKDIFQFAYQIFCCMHGWCILIIIAISLKLYRLEHSCLQFDCVSCKFLPEFLFM